MFATQRNMAAVAVLVAGLVFAVTGPVFGQKINQIKLTDAHVLGLIAAQDDFAPLAGQLAEAADKPSKELTAKLDKVAQKHGFKNFDEYRDVDNTIFLVLEGLDHETGAYVTPDARLALEIEEIKKDKVIPDADKKAIVAEVKEELALAEAVQHKESIAVVKKHFDKLLKLLPTPEDPGLPPPSSSVGDEEKN